jgi:hypothetical protein
MLILSFAKRPFVQGLHWPTALASGTRGRPEFDGQFHPVVHFPQTA